MSQYAKGCDSSRISLLTLVIAFQQQWPRTRVQCGNGGFGLDRVVDILVRGDHSHGAVDNNQAG